MDRDPHGNVMVSRIETEKLLIEMVEEKLKEWKAEGKFKGNSLRLQISLDTKAAVQPRLILMPITRIH